MNPNPIYNSMSCSSTPTFPKFYPRIADTPKLLSNHEINKPSSTNIRAPHILLLTPSSTNNLQRFSDSYQLPLELKFPLGGLP